MYVVGAAAPFLFFSVSIFRSRVARLNMKYFVTVTMTLAHGPYSEGAPARGTLVSPVQLALVDVHHLVKLAKGLSPCLR